MPYLITLLGDEPILLIKLSDPFDFREGPPAVRAEMLDMLGEVSGPFFTIFDIRELSIALSDLITLLTNSAYPQADPTRIFQKYGRMCIVGRNPLLTLSVESANRFLPSSGVTRAFDTLEAALEYARAELAGSH